MNTSIINHTFPSGQQLQLVHGDLTQEKVDAIVNAANAYLRHFGGVANAIVRQGGPEIQAESDLWIQRHGPVKHDQPAYTGGGHLPSHFVIHAVGPMWGEGNEDEKLVQAISSSLDLANRLGFTSLAMPPISTGIFGFPKERAARIFFKTIAEFFESNPESTVNLVRLTIIDTETLEVFSRVFADWGKESS